MDSILGGGALCDKVEISRWMDKVGGELRFFSWGSSGLLFLASSVSRERAYRLFRPCVLAVCVVG